MANPKHDISETFLSSAEEEKVISHIQKLRGITLSTTEAQAMRDRLLAYADLHTVTALTPRKTFFSIFFSATYLRASVAAAVVLVLVTGSTGAAYAAEDSLPGQPLYLVKVSIVEPIQTALIASPSAQATWQNTLAERRLAEASMLAADNDLATSTQQYLQNAVATHVALSEEDAANLAASGNQDAALAVRSDLEAKLSAHADILTLMAPRLAVAGDATTTDAVLALLQNVESERTRVEFSREATEASLATSATSTSAAASSTDARAAIAFVQTENADRRAEETHLFKVSAAMFGLLQPATSSASTTASSTEEASSTSAVHVHVGPGPRAFPGMATSSASVLVKPDADDSATVQSN